MARNEWRRFNRKARKNTTRVYIDVGDKKANKAIFDQLLADKDAIEADFGRPLEWKRLDDKRASRVICELNGMGGLLEVDRWDDLQDRMIDTMIRFDKAFRQRVRQIPIRR